ncbi:kinase domain protein (macronuclear) [Tetrahymena thermophila SB210]|uniref:Kinase domain protein n=1 Tax=Tetrahymena thermophila (strain SB210) TaxID=312017 RepID=W7X6B3_TETTS|nr:kinase domain protein [Tetrahymena thermophila SB210]EWS74910.1 kinase domain protein [Tetrahymena thermophila SB210]|eukprot:XP_012652623.1 kinase domain protein [Tetrahymena thermophila SB210]
MRSQKNIIIKKTFIPITIENETNFQKDIKNISKLGSICIEGSHMRASGSAPNLHILARQSISPEEYLSLKKTSNEKKAEATSILLSLKNKENNKSLNKLKLQPLTTSNAKQNQLPSLPIPLTSIAKNTIELQQPVKNQLKGRNQSMKKLKPLNKLEYQIEETNLNEQATEEKQEQNKKPKKIKKKKESSKETQFFMKRIYSTQEALLEIIKVIQELEIIVEGDISSQELIKVIENLIKGKDEAKTQMSLCRKEESFNMIYEKIYPKILDAICSQEFSDQYQYINKKFTEILNQTPHVILSNANDESSQQLQQSSTSKSYF